MGRTPMTPITPPNLCKTPSFGRRFQHSSTSVDPFLAPIPQWRLMLSPPGITPSPHRKLREDEALSQRKKKKKIMPNRWFTGHYDNPAMGAAPLENYHANKHSNQHCQKLPIKPKVGKKYSNNLDNTALKWGRNHSHYFFLWLKMPPLVGIQILRALSPFNVMQGYNCHHRAHT
ncbi:hypothetical protein CEXT_313171 [Caerostris extrusa]|uniref:Uncharacterized protein n=1 Tax=Caerostris extrusa TaxID=172846 RepID=A0AAV4MDG0_CAEEX|nr:hypothetical protein CEXT_313171 [Caerostris extrusa]